MQLITGLWLIYAVQVRCHSWVEQLSVVQEGQQGLPGYPRGYGECSGYWQKDAR